MTVYSGKAVEIKETMRYLLAYKRHDSDASENVLSRQSLTWNSVGECFSVVSAGLTQMSHEQRHVRLELTLGLAAKVSHQPVNVPTEPKPV